MKKILYIISLLMLSLLPALVSAQADPYAGEIRVNFNGYTLKGETVTFHTSADLSRLDLPKNEKLTFTPILRSTDGTREHRFAPVVVIGRERDKLVQRGIRFGDFRFGQQPDQYIVLTRDNPQQHVEMNLDAPFEKWMRQSYLIVTEQTTGCAGANLTYANGLDMKTYVGDPYRFAEPYTPVFEVSFLTPEIEAVKIRQDTYSARLQFQVNRTNLLPEIGNNAQVLAETRDVINKVKNDPLLQIREIVVKGYASPEGNTEANYRLSQGRAQALVDYLHRQNFQVSDRMITAQGMGEDWAGLRQALETYYSSEKDRVIEAIDNISDITRRKNTIRNMPVYRPILHDLYPPLRRNEYTISYEVRGFNVQEAKEMLRTRPQLLSLNEMFMVAELYDRDTPEFKEVFDIAARMYPDSPVAQFNVGAMEVENGSYGTAISRLEKIDIAEAWNNQGIAYWYKGEYEKALAFFRRAADAGLEAARTNIQEYEHWFEEKE